MIAEKTVYQGGPSKKLLLFWILIPLHVLLFYYLFMGFFLYRTYLQYPQAYPNFRYAFVPSTTFLLVAIGIMGFSSLYFYYLWKMYQYKISNEGVHCQRGILKKVDQFIFFDKITNVTVMQAFFERPFGIKNLLIQTAGAKGMRAEIIFMGLTDVDTPKQLIYQYMEKKKKSAKYDE